MAGVLSLFLICLLLPLEMKASDCEGYKAIENAGTELTQNGGKSKPTAFGYLG